MSCIRCLKIAKIARIDQDSAWQNHPAGHTGTMASINDEMYRLTTALLCASGIADGGDNSEATALLNMGGDPLIAHQIAQLRSVGINRFLIEIEELPGALVAMAERLRLQGAEIIYVRSPQELAGKITEGELLFVMCDGIIADDGLLQEVITRPSRYIITLDGREENSRFERIDLNSFWAGIAMLDAKSVSAIAALPEGWSIRSSLLRQALQDAVPHRPLNQELVLANQLRRIKTISEAEALGKHVLGQNARNVGGIVESKLFAPLIAAIAPKMLKSPIAAKALQFALPLLSVSALATAISGLAAVSAFIAILNILGLQLKSLLQHNDKKYFLYKSINGGMWAVLGTAFVLMAWKDAPQPYSAIFPPIVSLGLLALARKLKGEGIGKDILSSPALLAIAIFLLSIFGLLSFGIPAFVLLQLGLMLFPYYFRD